MTWRRLHEDVARGHCSCPDAAFLRWARTSRTARRVIANRYVPIVRVR